MISLRLARLGVRKKPLYRIVAAPSTRKQGGKALDTIGYWFPQKDIKKIDNKKLKKWIGEGAVLTDIVRKLCGI